VLYGEKVLIHESSGPWVRIEAVEQPEFTHNNKWEGYPGWVSAISISSPLIKTELRTAHDFVAEMKWTPIFSLETSTHPITYLPLGSWLKIESNNCSDADCDYRYIATRYMNRKAYLKTASAFRNANDRGLICDTSINGKLNDIQTTGKELMGVSYLWGGLSPGNPPPLNSIPAPEKSPPEIQYGIDCSGFVHLLYRVTNMVIPRDSHEQWLKAKPIQRKQLELADLIFSAKVENPRKITHVTLYAGDEQIIEAPQTGLVVRKLSFQEKYGKPLSKVESGDTVGDRVIYFGSFLQ